MSKTQIVTLRVPIELKARLERQAKQQGVSLNHLASYFLTTQLSQLETLSDIESRITKKDISELKARVKKELEAAPKNKPVPEWDSVR